MGTETKQIVIEVSQKDDFGSASCDIVTDSDLPFGYIMVACEYLLHVVAKHSGLPYDKAIEKLVEGAKTYADLRDNVIKI